VDVGADGAVRLSFTGLCTACWMRPITLERIVGPAFRDLEGVADIQVDGVRIQWPLKIGSPEHLLLDLARSGEIDTKVLAQHRLFVQLRCRAVECD
jgi:hypothetical protein